MEKALKIRLGARLFPKTNSELFAISFVVYYDIILKGFRK